MANRSYDDYIVVFEALKRLASNKNMTMSPEKITIDFELAAMKAYRNCFEGFNII
jgi:hypothetical protein